MPSFGALALCRHSATQSFPLLHHPDLNSSHYHSLSPVRSEAHDQVKHLRGGRSDNSHALLHWDLPREAMMLRGVREGKRSRRRSGGAFWTSNNSSGHINGNDPHALTPAQLRCLSRYVHRLSRAHPQCYCKAISQFAVSPVAALTRAPGGCVSPGHLP